MDLRIANGSLSALPGSDFIREEERLANKRASAAMCSGADGDDGDGDKDGAGSGEDGAAKKPRTLLEAAKELKKASENLGAATVKQLRAREEEHRMLREANQVCLLGVGIAA